LEDRATLYRSLLAGRQVLVVLDNAATVGQVRPLLPGETGSLVVVTSRNRLSGLVAREGAGRLQLDLLTQDDAVTLLREITAGYRADEDHAELVELARLCARLPLALRIAGERAASRPLMRPGELIADLRDESGLWDALSVNGDEEADAVRTVFAWSYRALPEPAARLFRLLGLHPGNEFSLPAAAALTGTTAVQARRDIDALVGAHLVEHSEPDRYQCHDLLRAYAVDQVSQLETEPVRTEACRRMLAWYLHTANAAQERISPFDRYQLRERPPADATPLSFDSYQDALRWYRVEATNLVAATRLAAGHGEHGNAWRLAAVLRAIQMHENAFEDWIATAQIGADSAARLDDPAGVAEALESLGKAHFQARRLESSEAHHRGALDIRRELGDRFGEGVSINALGLLELRRRHLDTSAAHFRHGARIFTTLGERRWAALLHGNLAETLCERGDFDAARDLLHEVLPVLRELGDRFGEGNGLFLLAWAHRGAGRLDQAGAAVHDALQIATADDNRMRQAHWLAELTRIQLAQGRPGDALVSSQQAAVIQRRLGDRSREATAIDLAGQAYQQLERPDEAADFHRRAASVHRDLADRWQLAGALDHLATALDSTGDRDRAQQCRQEAVSLLTDFDDPPAVAMRERLTRSLADR
jgi:tetratricopeptide (TPR) repeat protein